MNPCQVHPMWAYNSGCPMHQWVSRPPLSYRAGVSPKYLQKLGSLRPWASLWERGEKSGVRVVRRPSCPVHVRACPARPCVHWHQCIHPWTRGGWFSPRCSVEIYRSLPKWALGHLGAPLGRPSSGAQNQLKNRPNLGLTYISPKNSGG